MIFRVAILSIILVAPTYAVEPDIGTESDREAGKVIYMKHCTQCHGVDGNGKGVAQPFLKPWPRDFTKGVYKFKSTPDDRLPTTEDIMRVIRHGNPHTGMPAWPQFSEEELRNLAYHIKSFAPIFSDTEALKDESIAPIPLKIPKKAPSWSEKSARAGKELYKANKCFDCHGMSGRGSGTSAPTTEDMDGNQIPPRDLTKRWTYRNGSARLDIFRTLSMGIAPMPSYHNLSKEERWNLVDYVYSLHDEDNPNYGTVILSQGIHTPLDLSKGEELFKEAPKVYFPIFGQITQPGRAFYASANGLEVRSVYNEEEIAFLLVWHDMSPELNLKDEGRKTKDEAEEGWGEEKWGEEGSEEAGFEPTAPVEQKNGPDLEVSPFNSDNPKETPSQFSDAVAIQIPAKKIEGIKKPYFLFGDKNQPVDLWFADMANTLDNADHYIAAGAFDMKKGDDDIAFTAQYQDGRWMAIFKREREKSQGMSFNEGDFTPIAFSIWDGFNNERGNKRGLTEWFHVYLEPMEKESILLKMFLAVFLWAVLQLTVVTFVRKKRPQGDTHV